MIWDYILICTIIYAIAFAVLTSLAAKARGREPDFWALVGFVFGVFGLIAVLVMENVVVDEPGLRHDHTAPSIQSAKTKKCPDCAEEIKFEAKICRFCGKRFIEEQTAAPSSIASPQAAKVDTSQPYSKRDVRCPGCYTMNFNTDYNCSSCGRSLRL